MCYLSVLKTNPLLQSNISPIPFQPSLSSTQHSPRCLPLIRHQVSCNISPYPMPSISSSINPSFVPLFLRSLPSKSSLFHSPYPLSSPPFPGSLTFSRDSSFSSVPGGWSQQPTVIYPFYNSQFSSLFFHLHFHLTSSYFPIFFPP